MYKSALSSPIGCVLSTLPHSPSKRKCSLKSVIEFDEMMLTQKMFKEYNFLRRLLVRWKNPEMFVARARTPIPGCLSRNSAQPASLVNEVCAALYWHRENTTAHALCSLCMVSKNLDCKVSNILLNIRDFQCASLLSIAFSPRINLWTSVPFFADLTRPRHSY